MTYPLLKQCPKNHKSEEFLQYLRDNNIVILETSLWLVIENCKYHTHKKIHYTAFHKLDKYYTTFIDVSDINNLLNKFPDLVVYINPIKKRSITRYHVHLVTRPI